ncbi:phosphotransferase enzyme family protein [Histoplasma capsulatum G186AR]|uniref:Phosphotransferase enzyme family protein n=1 Tax=Ajellomyces capsulatus TaxID=5037 RepID=A0A8H8D2I6_AJECA|nr:phosphotransferase enzyme family protein [Histoplasma capsulatum]QSS67029.1 phosphotransferase enzyme family protein [Histoplasma capsulatum G186AR]
MCRPPSTCLGFSIRRIRSGSKRHFPPSLKPQTCHMITIQLAWTLPRLIGILTANSLNSHMAALLWMRQRISENERSDLILISSQELLQTQSELLVVLLSRSILMACSTKPSLCL